jgi:hypothetical protein
VVIQSWKSVGEETANKWAMECASTGEGEKMAVIIHKINNRLQHLL